jgi:hypothetical protein
MKHHRLVSGARLALLLAALGSVLPSLVDAQGRRRGGGRYEQYFGNSTDYYVPPDWSGNPVYDGRVTFVRIKYQGYAFYGPEGPGWAHDYPRAESHFDKIMREITSMKLFVEAPPIFGSTILAFDDPELFKYPVAYLSEPGGWQMSDTELAGFKKYITRGGFIVFDDMGCCGRSLTDLPHLVSEWKRAFPGAELVPLAVNHPIFDSFFKIDFNKVEGYYGPAEFYGFFEDNDPTKRLLAVINNNNDLGEYIEYSEQGFSVTPTNEAYKLAVNYFVYALTH